MQRLHPFFILAMHVVHAAEQAADTADYMCCVLLCLPDFIIQAAVSAAAPCSPRETYRDKRSDEDVKPAGE